MRRNKLNELLRELRIFISRRGGEVRIDELIRWIEERGGGELVLLTLLNKAEEFGIIECEGVRTSKNLPPFYKLPARVRLRQPGLIVTTKPVRREEKHVSTLEEGITVVSQYLKRYFSVGDLRIRDDLGRRIPNLDEVLREMERRGLIIYNREYGVITASEKLLKEGVKLHEYM